jgi:hypothetical protein
MRRERFVAFINNGGKIRRRVYYAPAPDSVQSAVTELGEQGTLKLLHMALRIRTANAFRRAVLYCGLPSKAAQRQAFMSVLNGARELKARED